MLYKHGQMAFMPYVLPNAHEKSAKTVLNNHSHPDHRTVDVVHDLDDRPSTSYWACHARI